MTNAKTGRPNALLITLAVSLVLNVAQGLGYARTQLETGMAVSLARELTEFEKEAKTAAEAASMIQYVETYYPGRIRFVQ